jgi:2,3-bisphosphoglycerate-independent phosphoglycerate mutase
MTTDRLDRGGFTLAKAVRDSYQRGQTDYTLEPVILTDLPGVPMGRIQNGDAVIFCCRRGEREIQLTEAFVETDFDRFNRSQKLDLDFVILTLYHEKFAHLPVAFAPTRVQDTLGEVVSRASLRQLRTAESEKFAHITFFLNGGSSTPLSGEDDIRIPSPKGIPFDQVPELSLAEVSHQVKQGIAHHYDLIVTNFANGDVIGHTASSTAKIRCAEAVDFHLGQVIQSALNENYVVLVTADHGNLEVMKNPNGTPHVAHTENLVPFILIDPLAKTPARLRTGLLADIAPTILQALAVEQPAAMSGASLAPGYPWGGKRSVLLVILDGWGFGAQDDTNPIFLAQTPVWDALLLDYPVTQLQASGAAVGLEPGKAGNSEAGHMNIGAGRVIQQDDVRLEQAMQDGSFYTNEILCRTIQDVKQRSASLHLIGLLTEKSSHGSIEYPLALLRMAKAAGLERVYLHMILDGRSTEPGSAPYLLEKLDASMQQIGLGLIVSGIGRGLALDRDGNYTKTKRAYDAFVCGTGQAAAVTAGGSTNGI